MNNPPTIFRAKCRHGKAMHQWTQVRQPHAPPVNSFHNSLSIQEYLE